MNTIAAVAQYSGPGGWSDPDLLIGPEVYVGGQTDTQARAQFSMWCLFPANLLISQNVLGWSAYALETYSNAEAIAVNQDPLASPARRIVGGDLAYPSCSGSGEMAVVTAQVCAAGSAAQQWDVDAATGAVSSRAFPGGVMDALACGTADGTPVLLYPSDAGGGTCGGRNQAWSWGPNSTLRNGFSGACLDVYDFKGPVVDTWACNGGTNQRFTRAADGSISSADGLCLTAQPPADTCTNVWGRTLSKGAWALGFVNNGPNAAHITCDSSCFEAMGVTAATTGLVVRDLWAHADVAHLKQPFSFSAPVNGSGFAALFKLTPE